MLKYPVVILSIIFSNYCLATDVQETNMYQEALIIDIYRQNKNISSKNWYFAKISSIKNPKDTNYLIEIVTVLKKEADSIKSIISTLKEKFSQNSTSNKDEIKTNISALQQAFNNLNYLKQLTQKLGEYCLKNATETESAIDKLLHQEQIEQLPTDYSKLKTFFEDFIKEVEKIKS